MKYLKKYNEGLNDLDELKINLSLLKSYLQRVKRQKLAPTSSNSSISDDFEYYFYDLMDDGWDIAMYRSDYYYTIRIYKVVKNINLEEIYKFLVDRMYEIKGRIEDEGFDSKFIIIFNGEPQQEVNPQNYREPIYKFQGVNNTSPDDDISIRVEYCII